MASVTPSPVGAQPNAAAALGLHRRLDLDETLAVLLADGLLTEPDLKRVRADMRTAAASAVRAGAGRLSSASHRAAASTDSRNCAGSTSRRLVIARNSYPAA